MKVTINFKIDRETLEMAIRHCLYYKTKISKKNLVETIKNEVYQKGIGVVNFSEFWGDDLLELDVDDEIIETMIKKYEDLIDI